MGIRTQFTFFLLLLGAIILPFQGAAQIAPETTVHKVDGKRVYLHTVQKGQTLYSLSKAYAIDIEDIVKENPGVEKGLTVNQIIKIPVRKVDKKEMEEQIATVEEGYLFHEVKPKETLFSLKRTYNISIDEILEANPEAKDGLKVGMQLKIPAKAQNKESSTLASRAPAEPDSLISHTVKPKETLYSLAKQYEVSIDSLLSVNKGLPNGLKVGTTIRIPKFTKEYLQQKQQIKKPPFVLDSSKVVFPLRDTALVKDTYRIAVLLPFYLNMNDTIEAHKKPQDDPMIFSKAKVALDIYKGIVYAADSLKNTKAHYEFRFFDTENDSNTVKELLADSFYLQNHMIIGPLYKSNFELVSKMIEPYGIPQISPVPLSNKILLGNPHVSKVIPSLPNHIRQITQYVLQTNDSANIILVNSTKSQDKPLYNLAKAEIRKFEIAHYDSLNLDTIKTMRLFEVDTNTLDHYLQDSGYYKLIVPSTDQVFVTELMTKIFNKEDIDSVEIYGLEPWTHYDNLDIAYLHGLSVHVTASEFIDLTDPNCLTFYKGFRDRFATDPSMFSRVGFRTAYFYMKALDLYGLNFPEKYDELFELYPTFKLNFFKTGVESGYENKFVHVLRYQNFELKEVWK